MHIGEIGACYKSITVEFCGQVVTPGARIGQPQFAEPWLNVAMDGQSLTRMLAGQLGPEIASGGGG